MSDRLEHNSSEEAKAPGKASRELDFIDFINENADVRDQERTTNAPEPRTLLINASVDDMQNIFEKDLLIKYQDTLKQISLNQVKLQEIHDVLRGIHAGGSGVFADIKNQLQEEANRIVSELELLGRQLIKLEKNPCLQNVIKRERLKFLREKAADEMRKLRTQYEESKQQAIQEREQANAQPNQETVSEAHKEAPKGESTQNTYSKQMLRLLTPMILSITLPLLMLNAPGWLISVVSLIILSPMLFCSIKLTVLIPYAYYIIKPFLYAWALVVTILGVQDFLAIAFYILMGLQTPKMIMNFIGTAFIVSAMLKGK